VDEDTLVYWGGGEVGEGQSPARGREVGDSRYYEIAPVQTGIFFVSIMLPRVTSTSWEADVTITCYITRHIFVM